MGFQPAWRTRGVMLMVPAGPESGFREGAAAWLGALAALSSCGMAAAD
jgi:hypothetical protein